MTDLSHRIRRPSDVQSQTYGLELSSARPTVDAYRAVYRDMLRIRLIEERIGTRYAEQEMRCPTHLCIGHEAPPAVVCAMLNQADLVFSNHRSHGHFLAKGGDLTAMIAELYGRATGCAGGKGGSQHLIDLDAGFMGSAPILASTLSVGVGAAWAAKLDGRDEVSAIFVGDGATEEGAFHEAMNYAAVAKLPILFVVENNLYSVHSEMDIRQPQRSIAVQGPAHGMVSAMVDGNRIDTVWQAAHAAMEYVRQGHGPALIECLTYRHREHCGPNGDLNLNYRAQDEFDAWAATDPLLLAEQQGQAEGWLTEASITAMTAEIEAEIDRAFETARAAPFPDAGELMTHVYPEAAQ